jgi:hypothetical protein
MRKKNTLTIFSVLGILLMVLLVNTPVQATINPNIEVGDVLNYETSLKLTINGQSASATTWSKYVITTINSTEADVDDVYADIYYSEYGADPTYLLDSDTQIGTIQDEFQIGEMFHPPNFEIPKDASLVSEHLQDKLQGIELEDNITMDATVTKFRPIWFKTGYNVEVIMQSSCWEDYDSYWDIFYDYNISMVFKDTVFYSSTGILLKSVATVEVTLFVTQTVNMAGATPSYLTETMRLKISSRIINTISTCPGVNEHPWYGRIAIVVGISVVGPILLIWGIYKIVQRKKSRIQSGVDTSEIREVSDSLT